MAAVRERRVHTRAAVTCPAVVARDLLIIDPSGVFAPRTHPEVERRTFPSTLRVTAASGSTVMQRVTVALGIPDTAGGARFPISWAPVAHRRVLPAFHGSLELTPDGDESCELHIEGAYTPPLGAPGALFDTVAGRRVAQRSIDDLASYAAIRLGETAAARRHSMSWRPPGTSELLRDRPPPEARAIGS